MSALGARGGRVLPHEVARAVHDHQLRVRQLPLKAVGAGHGRELVVLAPEQQRGHAQRGEVVALELREVAGAVQLELPAPARVVGVAPSSTRRSPRRSCRLLDSRITAPKPSRSMPAISCSPVPGSRSAFAMPCHLPSGKKPRGADHERPHGVGVLAGPAHSDQAAPVVHHEHAASRCRAPSGSARPTRCGAPRCPADPAPSRRSRRSRVPRRASPPPRWPASRRST